MARRGARKRPNQKYLRPPEAAALSIFFSIRPRGFEPLTLGFVVRSGHPSPQMSTALHVSNDAGFSRCASSVDMRVYTGSPPSTPLTRSGPLTAGLRSILSKSRQTPSQKSQSWELPSACSDVERVSKVYSKENFRNARRAKSDSSIHGRRLA
jgi:hypothetical protein